MRVQCLGCFEIRCIFLCLYLLIFFWYFRTKLTLGVLTERSKRCKDIIKTLLKKTHLIYLRILEAILYLQQRWNKHDYKSSIDLPKPTNQTALILTASNRIDEGFLIAIKHWNDWSSKCGRSMKWMSSPPWQRMSTLGYDSKWTKKLNEWKRNHLERNMIQNSWAINQAEQSIQAIDSEFSQSIYWHTSSKTFCKIWLL